MKPVSIGVAAILVLVFAVVPLHAEEAKLSARQSLDSLYWLAGHWQGDSAEAYYTTPKGGVILSVTKEFLPDGSCFHEYESFEVKGSDVIMTPYPNGVRSVSFTLVNYDPKFQEATFENKTNEFPSKITYRIPIPDNLLILISGTRQGKQVAAKLNLFRQK